MQTCKGFIGTCTVGRSCWRPLLPAWRLNRSADVHRWTSVGVVFGLFPLPCLFWHIPGAQHYQLAVTSAHGQLFKLNHRDRARALLRVGVRVLYA